MNSPRYAPAGLLAEHAAAGGAIDGGPVGAENVVHGSDQQGCSAGRPAVMITDHVPAVRVTPDHTGRSVAAAVPA